MADSGREVSDIKGNKNSLDNKTKKDNVAEKLVKWQTEKGRLKPKPLPWEPPTRLKMLKAKKLKEKPEKENLSQLSLKNKISEQEPDSTSITKETRDRKRVADISLSQAAAKRARFDSCPSGDRLFEVTHDQNPPARRDLLNKWREERRSHYAARLQARTKAVAERRNTLATQSQTVIEKKTTAAEISKRRQTVCFENFSVKPKTEQKIVKPVLKAGLVKNEPKEDKTTGAVNKKKMDGQKINGTTSNPSKSMVAGKNVTKTVNTMQPKTVVSSKASWWTKSNRFKNATSKIDTGLKKKAVQLDENITEDLAQENSAIASKTSAIPPPQKANIKKPVVTSRPVKKGVSVVSTKSPKKFPETVKGKLPAKSENEQPKKRTSISSLYRKGVKIDKIKKITAVVPEEKQKNEENVDLNTTITLDDDVCQTEDECIPHSHDPNNIERSNLDLKGVNKPMTPKIKRPVIDASNDGSFLLNESLNNAPNSIKKPIKTPLKNKSFSGEDISGIRKQASSSHVKFQQNSGFKNSVKKTPMKGILNSKSKQNSVKTPCDEDKENFSCRKSCSRSVSFVIPFEQTPRHEISNREKLLQWLQSRGKSLNEFKHLHCFGLHLSTAKQPNKSRLNKSSTPTVKSQDAITDPVQWNWDASPELSMPGSRITPCNELEAEEAFDLNRILEELIRLTDSDYPYQYISEWLDELCEYSPMIQKKANYWILRIKITQKTGFLRDIQQLLKHAMEHQAEPVHDLVKMMQEITIKEDESSSEDDQLESVLSTPGNTSQRVLLDSSNMFGSTVKRYSLTPAVKGVKKSDKKLFRYVATPVRRSARHPSLGSNKLEVPACIDDINELPASIRKNVFYKSNPALKDWGPQLPLKTP